MPTIYIDSDACPVKEEVLHELAVPAAGLRRRGRLDRGTGRAASERPWRNRNRPVKRG